MTRGSPVSRTLAVVALAGVAVSLGFGPASTAVERVREGIRHFTNGDFESAGKAFTEADVAEPENSTIAFDRGCAAAASGDIDKAKELFQQAALTRDSDLAARSHFNLGCLAAEQGRGALGDDPVAAAPEQRQEGLSLLLSAVGHYRDCLRLDAGHSDARHNLELIRLFIKYIQAQWDQQDREKARNEMGLLDFLAMIEQRQNAFRSTVRVLGGAPDSPQRRQSLSESSEAQSELKDEIEPLKEKIVVELQNAQPSPGGAAAGQNPPDNSQAEQAQKLLTQLADEAGDLMTDAASRIESLEFGDAEQKQREVLDRLNQIFMVVAPFSNVLQRATGQQEELTSASEAMTGSDESNADQADVETDEADASSPEKTKADEPGEKNNNEPADSEAPDADYQELRWKQSQVTDWSRMLSLKAQAELPGVEAQLQAAQAQQQQSETDPAKPEDDPAKPGEDPANPHAGQDDPSAQLEAMQASLQKAIELGPKVVDHSTSAADSLAASNMVDALPDQQEALKLLRDIAEPLAQQNQPQDKQQDGDRNHQDQDQNSQQQQQPSDQQQKQNQQQQTGQTPQERAMSVLRRARERERRHRDLQKQLQQMIGGRVRVDRDW